MIINKVNDVYCSYGDTFRCSWEVEGYPLSGKVKFSIKATTGSTEELLTKEAVLVDQAFYVEIPANEFSVLPVGNYVYDLVMIDEETIVTLLWPANFYIKAVIHNE